MKKTLFSLMLDEDVVREVDILAHRNGTNRSNLINQILAEHLGMITPERRINDVFRAIEEAVMPYSGLVPFFVPNNMTMSLKSSLEYKYRPTVKYEVELYKNGTDSIGELTVIFRTQSATLINEITEFFRLWRLIELKSREDKGFAEPDYALYENRFCRSIATPKYNVSAEELAEAISGYIELFDEQMKGYLTGKYSAEEIYLNYENFIKEQKIML